MGLSRLRGRHQLTILAVRPGLLLALALVVVGGPQAVPAASSSGPPPRQVIQSTIEQVLVIMGREEVPKEARLEQLKEIIYAQFDFETMSKLILARNWKKFSSDQRREFMIEFKTYLANSYSDRLDRYSGEVVEILGERQEARGDVTVLSQVSGGEFNGALINYRLRSRDGGPWRVIDVIVEGVSFVSNYRDQFREIVSNGGPQHLLEALREKNEAGIADAA